MTDFVWPSDEHRAENREIDYVCDYLEDTLDQLNALRAANRDLQDWKDSNGQYGWPPFDGECE
jgi:hypothetical protein